MGDIINELNAIVRAKDKVVANVARGLFRDLVRLAPVGNKRLWLNPNSAPKGYQGGTLKSAWNIEKVSNDKWIIFNDTPYAELRTRPLIIDSNGAVLQGSKQNELGIDPIIEKWNNKLQDDLRKIR